MGDSEKVHCPNHTDNMERIAKLEAGNEMHKEDIVEIKDMFKELFAKHDSQLAELVKVRLCVENTSVRVSQLEEAIRKRAELGDAKILWADQKVQEIENKFTELDKFKWFREWMTALRDNVLKYVFIIIIGVLTLVAFFHRKDIFDIVSNYFKSK